MDRKNKVNNDGKASMYIVNHFLDIQLPGTDVLVPDRDSAARTNAPEGPGSIGAQADLCVAEYGRYPNVILVDYFGRGDSMAAQSKMNVQ